MWLQLLEKMSLIDDVIVSNTGSTVTVSLEAVKLAQLRPEGAKPGEAYTVTWTQNGNVRTDLANKFTFSLPTSGNTGSWTVAIKYTTPEIRSDPNGYTTATERFTI